MASDTTNWPLLEDRRPPLGQVKGGPPTRTRRRPARPGWLLAALAFLCGGLVSAAIFTIGWRHQAQQGNAAETALARATTHEHTLGLRLDAARRAEARDRRAAVHARHLAAAARTTAQTLSQETASVAAQAGTADRSSHPLTQGAAAIATDAAKVASELKTLTTYLTTTPSDQIDSGYVASQATYLAQQLADLQSQGADLGGSAASFEAAMRKLARLSAGLAGA